MPCLLTSCTISTETVRFLIALVAIYAYHKLIDTFLSRPFVRMLKRTYALRAEKEEKCRESLWKNSAVLTFFVIALYITIHETWFMNPQEYFDPWPTTTSELLRWYYMFYAAYWIQSADFLLSVTGHYYTIQRKDNIEMLIHHLATLTLMIFSYFLDFTRIGICVLMIHDVNDLLLETAKIFVYLNWDQASNIMFGIFAIVWYLLRWFFYADNIIYTVYSHAYKTLVANIMMKGGYGGYSPIFWYRIWLIFVTFLCILLLLHIYWGYLIGLMVIAALRKGQVENDIRSDDEGNKEGNVSDEEKEEKEEFKRNTKSKTAQKNQKKLN